MYYYPVCCRTCGYFIGTYYNEFVKCRKEKLDENNISITHVTKFTNSNLNEFFNLYGIEMCCRVELLGFEERGY